MNFTPLKFVFKTNYLLKFKIKYFNFINYLKKWDDLSITLNLI